MSDWRENCPTALAEKLEQLRDEVQRLNPDRVVLLDEGAVWLRCPEEGTDYAMFSVAVGNKIVCTYEAGRCYLHRPIPTQEAL